MTAQVVFDPGSEAWDDYVDAHPRGTPYHRRTWSDSLQFSFGHEPLRLAAMDDDRVTGVLPLVVVRSALTGTRIISTPFAGYGGPLADDAATADLLIERARTIADESGATHLTLHFADPDLAPPSTQTMVGTDLYSGFRAHLPDDPEQVLTCLPQKSRRMVRLGLKAGLRAACLAAEPATAPLPGATAVEPHIATCYDLLATTMRNLGTPVYPLSYLRRLTADDPQRWFVFAVFDGDRVVAAVWVGAHGRTLYPHFVGYDRDYYKVGVSNFLYWALMRRGTEQALRTVDMGRSKVGTGAYDFKRNMGLQPEPLGYRYYVPGNGNLPEINPTNKSFSAAISIWRRLPLGLVKRVGPHLVGHFA